MNVLYMVHALEITHVSVLMVIRVIRIVRLFHVNWLLHAALMEIVLDQIFVPVWMVTEDQNVIFSIVMES